MSDLLFFDYDLGRVLDSQERTMADEIGSLSENQTLNSSHEDLCRYFVEKYRVGPIEIDEPNITADYGDAKVDVSHRFEYAVFDRSRPFHITGTRLTFYIPFQGDRQLLKCQPATYTFNPPRATITPEVIMFVYERTTADAENIEREFEQDRNNLKKYLEWIARDVEAFNAGIQAKASQHIAARRDKLLHDKGLAERIGFPLKRREGMPATFVAPSIKRRLVPQPPSISKEPYRPEPALGSEDYEHILSVLSNMTMVMERSPKAFKDMDEESLRTHFLVHLNGHYEGQATGETFNYEGKTDILIRVDGRNIFIAECKFWSGPAGLTATLDQLLGYTSWRDTKAAILVFNRDRQMSTVLSAIPGVLSEHPSYKASRGYESETGFRCVFGHRDDPNREMILTVLVFDVPG